MGKLNYTHRKTSGVKLGSTVKRDLQKRVSNGNARTALKDPHLELNICGKVLGDDGLRIVCEALCYAIQAGATKLEELILSDNEITIKGLQWLSKVIKLSAKDLKDLDLSRNKIAVRLDEDVSAWEAFLKSFRDVNNLRRLNLANNPLGPDKAFETLLRCYSREPPLYLPRSFEPCIEDDSEDELEYEEDSSQEAGSEDTDSVVSPTMQALSLTRELSLSPPTSYSPESTPSKSIRSSIGFELNKPATSSSCIVGEFHGLRSIPYLILSDTGMEDVSALHLSYLLAVHPLPKHLLQFLPLCKTGPPSEVLEAYDSDQICTGIIYLPNPNITSLGSRVLEITESYRIHGARCCWAVGMNHRRISDVCINSGSPTKQRSSFNSPTSVVGSTDGLDRSRSKIQGTILRDTGPNMVELWKAALKTLVLTRTLLMDDEPSSSESPSHTFHLFQAPGYFRTPLPTSPGGTLASHPQSVSPQSYKVFRMSQYGTGSPHVPVRSCTILPGKLPEHLWQKIINMAADPNSILSTQQARNVHEWGRQRETLRREKEFSGKLPSVQIWRFLEGLDCLTYEV